MTGPARFLAILAAVWLLLFAVGATLLAPPYFRPYERLMHPNGIHFLPNKVVEMDAYGVLSFRSYMTELRHTRSVRFTTDAAGFRNLPMRRPPRVVVVGDSFILGAGATDHDAFPVLLSKRLGEPVYNYGAQKSWGAPYYLVDQRFIARPPAVVLWMPSQMRLQPLRPLEGGEHGPPPSRLDEALQPWLAVGPQLQAAQDTIGRDNGLTLLFREHYKRLHRRAFGYPNLITVDGEPAIVMSPEQQLMKRSHASRWPGDVVSTFVKFRDAVQARGTLFVFAPLPGQAEIYLDAFTPEQRAGVQMDPSFREHILSEMAAAGTTVVDLGPAFRANRSPYLWHRDDTHWTPRAAALAADVIARQLVRPPPATP